MANLNTTCDVIYQQNNGQPIVLPFLTQGHFAFTIGSGAAIASIPNPQVLIESDKTFPSRSAQGVPFYVRAAGLISSTARGQQYQIDINVGTTLSPAFASLGLITIPNGLGTYEDNWYLEAQCMWDAGSLNLRGMQIGWAGATAVTHKSTVPATVADLAALQFNVAVTMPGTTVGTTTFTLTEFSTELQ